MGEWRGFGDRLGEATAGSRSLRYISCWLETLHYPGVDLDCKRCVKELNRQKILKSQNEEKVRIKVLKMNRFLGCIQSLAPLAWNLAHGPHEMEAASRVKENTTKSILHFLSISHLNLISFKLDGG